MGKNIKEKLMTRTMDENIQDFTSSLQEEFENFIASPEYLWGIYDITRIANGGIVPYDPYDVEEDVPDVPADFCKGNTFNYGVKAEKAKHRKSRKSTRLEGTKHQGIWSGSAQRRYNNEWIRRAEEKAYKKFKQNHQHFLYEGNEYLKELREDYKDNDFDDFYFADLTPEEEEEIRNFYPEKRYWKEYKKIQKRETEEKLKLTEEEKAQKKEIVLTALARKAICDDETFFVTEKGAFTFVNVYNDPYDFDYEKVGIALVKRESKYVRKTLLTFLHSESSVEEIVEKVIEII